MLYLLLLLLPAGEVTQEGGDPYPPIIENIEPDGTIFTRINPNRKLIIADREAMDVYKKDARYASTVVGGVLIEVPIVKGYHLFENEELGQAMYLLVAPAKAATILQAAFEQQYHVSL